MKRVIYLHRITDGAYFIYKLSNYDVCPIKLINVGLVYNKLEDYTNNFKKKITKYNLEEYDDYIHIFSESYKDFLYCLYLDIKTNPTRKKELIIPSKAMKIVEREGVARVKNI